MAAGHNVDPVDVPASSDSWPPWLRELITLGRTLHSRTADVLAYVDRPGTGNGPTEAINDRLEQLRGPVA